VNDTNRTQRFTLLEIFVVLVVFAGPIMWILETPNSPFIRSGRQKLNATQQRSIVMVLHAYAKDHEGNLPSQNAGGASFTNSTDAYQFLLQETGLKEQSFYTPGQPMKRKGANNNGELLPEENCLIYVSGLNTSMPPDSPVIADEMESPGVYGANHPWLKDGSAVVTYLDGHAKVERLTQKSPGATVLGPPESGIKDIFQFREQSNAPGLLAVPREHILLP